MFQTHLHRCNSYCEGEVHCEMRVCGMHIPEDMQASAVAPPWMTLTHVRRAPEGDMLEGPSAIGWFHHHNAWLFFGTFNVPTSPCGNGILCHVWQEW